MEPARQQKGAIEARAAGHAAALIGRDGDNTLMMERFSNAHFAALDMLHHPVWVFDVDRKRVYWANRAAMAQVWRAGSLAELCARDLGAGMSCAVEQRLIQYRNDFISHGAVFDEQWTLYPHGEPLALHVTYSGYPLPDGRMAMLCEGRRAAAESPEALRSVDALLHTPVGITLYDEQGRALYRNPAARAAAPEVAQTWSRRCSDEAALQALRSELQRDGAATGTLCVRTSHGLQWCEVSARHCLDAVTGEKAILVSEVDVTALVKSEARARYLAVHDPLTGLANRTEIRERFEHVTALLRQRRLQAALVLIDLDNFKDINDTLGHEAGDRLLVQVANSLKRAVRDDDLAARLGGDEFLLLISGSTVANNVQRVYERVRESIRALGLGSERQACVNATAGASVFPDDGSDFDTLLRRADVAMYEAKRAGRGQLAFYAAHMDQNLRERMQVEQEIRQALQRREFVVHYQPKVQVRTGSIIGAEALVRWQHPTRGLLMPDEFIPACEAMGVVGELGQQVFESATQQQARWAAQGLDLVVSVNVSPQEFSDPVLSERLRRALERAGCHDGAIQVEITESMLLAPDDAPQRTLKTLTGLGLSIALDDFGTGYSNLATLQNFPISVLKIDRSFMQDLDQEKPLARLIVDLCSLMRLEAVAEGVETPAQYAWVRAAGIEEMQGWFISSAMPADQFLSFARHWHARPGDAWRGGAQARAPSEDEAYPTLQ